MHETRLSHSVQIVSRLQMWNRQLNLQPSSHNFNTIKFAIKKFLEFIPSVANIISDSFIRATFSTMEHFHEYSISTRSFNYGEQQATTKTSNGLSF